MIKKFCLACGKEFRVLPKRKETAKFCSRECHYNLSRIKRECLFCGKQFRIAKHRKRRRFCSRKCSDEAKKKRITKKCLICNNNYKVQAYLKDSKYCSIKCRNKGLSITLKGKFKGEKNPSYKGKITKVCKYCGKEFKVHPYKKDIANHCSIRCSKLNTSKETRKKIAKTIKKIQEENPRIHPNYILAQKGHVTKIEKIIKKGLEKRGLIFKNQYRILNYWVDFAFPEINLAIECDGERWHSTKEQISKDKKRDLKIKEVGWEILRFKEIDINNNTKKVLDKIEKTLKEMKK